MPSALSDLLRSLEARVIVLAVIVGYALAALLGAILSGVVTVLQFYRTPEMSVQLSDAMRAGLVQAGVSIVWWALTSGVAVMLLLPLLRRRESLSAT